MGVQQVPELAEAIAGVILGTAVGDSIGLPREGLSRRRARRLFGSAPLEHRLLLGRGMVSDDTDHTCMAAQALLVSGGEPEHFSRELARRLRWWLLAIPAGVGLATLKSILRLWLGFSPAHSGVHSAGNGPAMRSALLGVYARDHAALLRHLVAASTRLTHTDPRAEQGALLVAMAAAHGSRLGSAGTNVDGIFDLLLPIVTDVELADNLRLCRDHLNRQSSPDEFAHAIALDRGVTGYINHTVPVALFCWLRHPRDFRAAVESAILLGGDTDTVGAITGALAGATQGVNAIPASWVRGICDYPWSVDRMRRLAHVLSIPDASHSGIQPLWPAVLARNLVFALVVISHALRRLLPPY
jgi:ADP-ribosyl-[dinitrogen reductase] hydrolase